MRIGFCAFDKKEIAFAAEAGFDGIEMFANEEILEPDGAKIFKEMLDENGVALISLFHYANYAAPDPADAEKAINDMHRAMDACKIMGTDIVTCNAWAAGEKREEQIQHYKKTFGEFAKAAEDKGVKIAIENCPHGNWNIAYSPEMWEKMFNEVPSLAIGLEFDPSHLVRMFVDWLPPLYEFGDRVYMFHAKDTEIMDHVLARVGIHGRGWWRYRLPGMGQVDWTKAISALHDIGYKGDMVIEHEDPIYRGELVEKGLKMGLANLRALL